MDYKFRFRNVIFEMTKALSDGDIQKAVGYNEREALKRDLG